MSRTRKATSIVALTGAAALGAALLVNGGGVGAAFSDSATVKANISVGTFGCELSSDNDHVEISPNGHVATINFPALQSSKAGTMVADVTVTNTKSIPLLTSWSASTQGSLFDNNSSKSMKRTLIPLAAVLNENQTDTVSIGFSWDELNEKDLGKSGSATFKLDCLETAPENLLGFGVESDGGAALWDADNNLVELGVGSNGNNGASIFLIQPGNLPEQEPMFLADNFKSDSPGSLRFYINFEEGGYLSGFPSEPDHGYWIALSMPSEISLSGHLTWDEIYEALKDFNVRNVQVLMDTKWKDHETNITCLNYDGPIFGTGC